MGINKNGTAYYVHNDHLNTPTINKIREFETCLKFSYFVIYQVTNANNAVVFDWPAVDPFGANQPIINTIDFNIRYPGQYYDAETAYHYNYHRYYNPQTGKYLQADPIGLAGGYNLYNYVDNNSLRAVDPTGEIPLIPIVVGGFVNGFTAYVGGGSSKDIAMAVVIGGFGGTGFARVISMELSLFKTASLLGIVNVAQGYANRVAANTKNHENLGYDMAINFASGSVGAFCGPTGGILAAPSVKSNFATQEMHQLIGAELGSFNGSVYGGTIIPTLANIFPEAK